MFDLCSLGFGVHPDLDALGALPGIGQVQLDESIHLEVWHACWMDYGLTQGALHQGTGPWWSFDQSHLGLSKPSVQPTDVATYFEGEEWL